MRKFYAVVLANVNKYSCQPKHRIALRIISYLIKKNDGLLIGERNEILGERLTALLHIRHYYKIKRLVIFTLSNLGFSKSKIASLTGLHRNTVSRNVKSAENCRETKSDFMTIKEGIVEVWV